MAQNIYRRDFLNNLIEIPPSKGEIVTIEDYAKHGIFQYGGIKVIAQLIEKDGGIVVRDWEENFGKGSAGVNSFDVSTSKLLFGGGAVGANSFVSGLDVLASGSFSFAAGNFVEATGDGASAFGIYTSAQGEASSTSGSHTVALGNFSHAEGNNTEANGESSHAEGNNTEANGESSHAEGIGTQAQGVSSHAEGNGTIADGDYSHAEGNGTTANGISSHSEGYNTEANGDYSHASGLGTIASSESQTVIGSYNEILDSIFTIGIGDSEINRKNGFFVTKEGRVVAPSLEIGLIDTLKSLVTREYVEDKITIETHFVDFTVTDPTKKIYRSDILSSEIHSIISSVHLEGMLLRNSKFTFLDDGGYKAIQIDNSVTLNEGDWISIQVQKVYFRD